MRQDLEKLEAFLKENLSTLLKASYSHDLGKIFERSALSAYLEEDPAHVAFLETLLPPKGREGTINDILKHWTSFSLCLYHGRVDAFWEELAKGPPPKKPYEWDAMGELIQGFRKDALDERSLADRILAGHVLYDMMPGGKSAALQFRVAGDKARGTGSPAEETEKFFTTQRAGLDFSTVMNVAPNGWSYMPEDSLSSHLAYLRVNPKMHLVAADFTGQIFAEDGNFFEGANLRYACLMDTLFDESSSIDGMRLEGAIILSQRRGVFSKGLTEERLAHTYIDESTVLPKRFDRARIMEMHQSLGMPPAPPITEFEWASRDIQRARLRKKYQSSPPDPSPSS